MHTIASSRLTANLCRTKAKEFVQLAEQTLPGPQHIMLKHIAETWERIADSLSANDA
jgi:hypothetical protein